MEALSVLEEDYCRDCNTDDSYYGVTLSTGLHFRNPSCFFCRSAVLVVDIRFSLQLQASTSRKSVCNYLVSQSRWPGEEEDC